MKKAAPTGGLPAQTIVGTPEGPVDRPRRAALALAEVRKARDLRQVDVARALGIHKSNFARLERGEELTSGARQLRVAAILRCHVGDVFAVDDVVRYLWLEEATDLLGVWRQTVRKRLARGAYPGVRLPTGKWAIEASQIVHEAIVLGRPFTSFSTVAKLTGLMEAAGGSVARMARISVRSRSLRRSVAGWIRSTAGVERT